MAVSPPTDPNPIATHSLHGDFLEQASPQWLIDTAPFRKQALKDVDTQPPAWFQDATPEQRAKVAASFLASLTAQTRLDRTMSQFQGIEDFARPLLLKALKDQYQVEVDVTTTLLCLRRPLAISVFEIELSSFELLKLSMLDAALHNFEASECKAGAYHETSGFVRAAGDPGTYESVTLDLTVSQFMSLCRSLDIGAQYQAYLQSFFYPENTLAQSALRDQFINSQKTALKAAAEQALVTGDIEAADYRMIVSVIDGEVHPWMGSKQVWFRTLSLMGLTMTGCMIFLICEKYHISNELIVYIPQDPAHPLKRYNWAQLEAELKRLFTARDAAVADGASPTPYQVFFSQFVPYDKRSFYFSQFTQKAADSPTDIWHSPWRKIADFINPATAITGFRELPPERRAKLEPVSDPYLNPLARQRRGKGIWADNIDPWQYLYDQHREKVIADARSHAVPSQDIDAKAREAKLAHLLEIGMLGLNVVSMFVPVLGEVMMVVMAGQLLYETLEGVVEWGEGDRRAAKAHLIDVAQNLAQILVMAGVGAGVAKWRAVNAEPVIEALNPVSLPNGQTRLWRPSLARYAVQAPLDTALRPNELGQYVKDGRTYIRQGNQFYEQVYDDSLNKWRIKHPTDTAAYQPILEHNGHGAWRHTLERPLEWDRLTLLRRIGHPTDAFTDQQLLMIGEISEVSDNALRKMHMDHTAAPPALQDSLRMFKAELDATRVIEQVEGTQPIDNLYLYALPLIVEMPRWPQGQALEVFKGPGLSGESVIYGYQGVGAPPPIKMSRSDVLGGELPTRVLAALDDAQVVRLLGGEAARVREARAQEFNKQLGDYASQRQPAIFQSIYGGTEPVNGRTRLLQRTCPGLSDAAAHAVLEHARPDELEQLVKTRRVPLNMLEEARWYARQGRLARAYAGLRSEVVASADSRRLALRALEKLPGWPDTLRVEVREGRLEGALLDSAGAHDAGEIKYLVKHGPSYQAFNERGEELNSLPRRGDNFYPSLMHALPDQARQRLGVAQVSQHAELQRKLIAQANTLRGDAIGLLAPQTPRFKPPVRISQKRWGYYASGRGPASSSPLHTRVRNLYPDLSDEQVNGFLLEQLRAGKTARDLANDLIARFNERAALHATLNRWVEGSAANSRQFNHLSALALKESWGRALLAGKVPGADALSLYLLEPMPALTADFSYVRELSLTLAGSQDANIESVLKHFPALEKLDIHPSTLSAEQSLPRLELTNVPLAVAEMKALRTLVINFKLSRLSSQLPSSLAALTQLEQLEIASFDIDGQVLDSLDLSPLQQLKTLRIVAPFAGIDWPAYVEQLPLLERLDLSQTGLHEVPATLYSGHEQLWAGLSMDWSKFEYEAFRPAYEYVKQYAGPAGPHLMNLDEMVRGYIHGELREMASAIAGNPTMGDRLSGAIMDKWDTPQARMNAVEALRSQYVEIFSQFYQGRVNWRDYFAQPISRWEAGVGNHILLALKRNWLEGVYHRYDIPTAQLMSETQVLGLRTPRDATVFQLPDAGDRVVMGEVYKERGIHELPRLPVGSFSYVKNLSVAHLSDVPVSQLREFLQAFSGVETLQMPGIGLSQLPITADAFPKLTRLGLNGSNIKVTRGVQAQLNGMKNLQVLDLGRNPLGTLDVTALTQLTHLNLRNTELKAWPAGVEGLAELSFLDLRDNKLTKLAPAVLAHPDLLMKTELTGNGFKPDSVIQLDTARRAIEVAKGLPEGALSRFAENPPDIFQPHETADSIAAHLLPLPTGIEGLEGAAGAAARVQRLNPAMSLEQALGSVEGLRRAAMDDKQIEMQINQWYQTHEVLTRQLNGWLFTRGSSFESIPRQTRAQAARLIRQRWLDGVVGRAEQAVETLNLQGLEIGDLPVMTVPFPHIRTLDLTGNALRGEQSTHAFLNNFRELNRLILNNNRMTTLPQAIRNMPRLEWLGLSGNLFADATYLSTELSGERLLRLDLSRNSLEGFDMRAFSRLQTLDLSYNRLSQWPEGALDASQLTTLNLSGNGVQRLPGNLLDGSHDGLVSGTDLSENHSLDRESLERMRDYSDAHARMPLMGMSRAELDRALHPMESASSSGSDASTDSEDDDSGHATVAPAEAILHPQQDVAPTALEPWLANASPERVAQRTALWNQLAGAEDHERFFYLVSMLRLTVEFSHSRANLTERVWSVIEAAAQNAELRDLLFIEAGTHGTCIDGRILTFSELEVRVFEYRALLGIPLQRLDLRGRALLNLSRQLFRLGRVDQIAEAAAVSQDRAEVRLSYRIGLTGGWPDGLGLPGQPAHMAYGRPIEGALLARTRARVLAAESTDDFVESLISRDYWVSYLDERYAEPLGELDALFLQKHDALEEANAKREHSAENLTLYAEELNRFEIDRAIARNVKLLELSRTEIQRLASLGPMASVPEPASPVPGPSWRV